MDDMVKIQIAQEVDALVDSLEAVRFRHVAGLEPEPELVSLFQGSARAAHRETVTDLRAAGETELADRRKAVAQQQAESDRLKTAAAQARALLADGSVDRIFVPAVLECPPRPGIEQSHTCLYSQQCPTCCGSSSAGASASLVTVCSIASLFFHTTFVPAGTSSVAGRKRKVLMVTLGFVDAAPADGAMGAAPENSRRSAPARLPSTRDWSRPVRSPPDAHASAGQ